MSWYYAHTLIPSEAGFVPEPQQLADFLNALKSIGGEPVGASYRLGTLTGEMRKGGNPLTGEEISIPSRSFAPLAGPADIADRLKGIEYFDLLLEGEGPCALPPFNLYTANTEEGERAEFPYNDSYAYEIQLCLRPKNVSTSDWHEEIAPERVAPFGEPCDGENRKGYFHHPVTGAVIEVENAGCARFWIQFQCGKWTFPRIGGANLNVLEPRIVEIATDNFGVGFAQGCVFG